MAPPHPKRRKIADKNMEESIKDFKLIIQAGRLTPSRTIVEEKRGTRTRDGASFYALRRARLLAFKYLSEWITNGKIPPAAVAYLRSNDPGLQTCIRLNISDMLRESEESEEIEESEEDEEMEESEELLNLNMHEEYEDEETIVPLHITAADADGGVTDSLLEAGGPAPPDTEDHAAEEDEKFYWEDIESEEDELTECTTSRSRQKLTFIEILQKWQAESGNTLTSLTRLLYLLKKYNPDFDASKLPKNAKNLMKVRMKTVLMNV